jgi:carbamoylphosphate synthase large subunit
MHSYDLIRALKDNYDSEEIYVVGINCDDTALLRKGVDAGYVVPRITEESYIPTVIDICEKEKVDVILPFITAELPIMAENRELLESHGVKVSISSMESILASGNKVELAKHYPDLMPKQMVCKKPLDFFQFADEIGYPKKPMCCKLPNRCGGLGFCIIDEEKGRDLTIYNKFGMNRYITFDMLLELAKNCHEDIIMQEYEEGLDYSMCVLADHGRVLHALGFEGYLMAFGSAMFAGIKQNEQALAIAKQIVADTGLDGNVCFDFILKEDGSVKLLETNPRLSASLPFIAKAGLNLPYLRCRQLLGYDVENIHPEINYNLRMSKNYESEYFV